MSSKKLKKIEILRDTMVGQEVARVGSVCSCEESEANYLIVTKYAKEAHVNAQLKRVPKPKPVVEKEESK